MSKVLTVAGVSILALALVLGMAAPAMAASNSPPWADDLEGEIVMGEVISVGDQEFVIQYDEEELTIAVDDDTRYYQMSVPARLMALARHRLQLEQQDQMELRNQAGHGRGWQNQVAEAVEARNQPKLQERVEHQMERAPLLALCWLSGFCPFGGQAEFADIAVGDGVVVLAEDNLARVVVCPQAS